MYWLEGSLTEDLGSERLVVSAGHERCCAQFRGQEDGVVLCEVRVRQVLL